MFVQKVSNHEQTRRPGPVIVELWRGTQRNSFLLLSADGWPHMEFFAKLLSLLRPQTQQVGSQRMCPFCGLITPRAKRLCLECGKPLRAVHTERKDAEQE